MPVAIVEDDARVRDSLQFLFATARIQAHCFDCPESFLATDPTRYDCIISDVKMPGISGYEFQRELIRREQHIPFIFISAYPEQSNMEQALRLGAVAFLSKPLDGEELLHLVLQLIPQPPPSSTS